MSIGIGKTVIAKQSYQTEPELSDIAALTPTDGLFIVGNGTDFVGESGATVRTSLGLGSVATYDIDDIPGVGATAKTYYLNATDASDIGTYVIAQTTPSTNVQSNIVQANTGTAYTLIASFATPVGEPNIVSLPAGIATRTIWATTGASNETAMLKIELYKRTAGGVETLLRTSTSSEFSYTTISPVIWTAVFASASVLNLTDRLVFKLYTARVSGPATVTTTVYFEDGVTPSYIGTTITESNAALTALALPGTPSAADKFLYSSATGTWAYGDATAAGRALLDDASAAAQATTLGLGTGDSPIWTGATLRANAATAIATLQASNAAATGPDVILRHTRGTIGSETATQSGDVLGRMLFGGFDDALTDSAMIRGVATETWSPTAAGSKLEFYTVDNTTLVQDLRLTIDHNGGVTCAGTLAVGSTLDSNAAIANVLTIQNTPLLSRPGTSTDIALCANSYWQTLSFYQNGALAVQVAAGDKLLFGAAGDTNLYRSAANTLSTDDAFTAAGEITGRGVVIGAAGPGGESGIQLNANARIYYLATSQVHFANNSGQINAQFNLSSQVNPKFGFGTLSPATTVEIGDTITLAAGVADGYSGTLTLDPAYTGAYTVTRHNYVDVQNVDPGTSTITDAALFRFDAAAGTHKATVGATTKIMPGGVDAWVKININGTIYYMPCYISTTA